MDAFTIGGTTVGAGESATVELPLPQLYTHTPLTLPVHVVRGRRDGPSLFVSAAIHGDELNGVEIISRLLRRRALRSIRGTLIAVPIVNVYGVLSHSRYLPDRRDLNRSFPGSDRGSLAARLAELFMREVVANSTHGIDLHTGAQHRENLPQVRGQLDDAVTIKLARAFGAPLALNAVLRDGSLRQAAADLGIPILVYEAGEALRFDELSIRAGTQGILNVMRALEMIPDNPKRKRHLPEPQIARSSSWVRAPESGIFRATMPLGSSVDKDEVLGVIADPFGEAETEVRSTTGGVVIGRTRLPLVHQGEALYHIARFEDADDVAGNVEEFQSALDDGGASPEMPVV